MGKNKKNPHPINIQNLNMEIDYDKLAEAIVRAERKANEITQKLNMPEKKKLSLKEYIIKSLCNIKDFFVCAGYIITNKKQTNGTMASGMLAIMMSATFNLLAILAIILAIVCFCSIGHFMKNNLWSLEYFSDNILQIGVCFFGGIFSALFALILRGSANEISVEQDRNYITSVFSAIVGFAALVIALIALVRGVA